MPTPEEIIAQTNALIQASAAEAEKVKFSKTELTWIGAGALAVLGFVGYAAYKSGKKEPLIGALDSTEPDALELTCGCGTIDKFGKGACSACDEIATLYGDDPSNAYCLACWRSIAVDPQGHGQVCDGDWSKRGLREKKKAPLIGALSSTMNKTQDGIRVQISPNEDGTYDLVTGDGRTIDRGKSWLNQQEAEQLLALVELYTNDELPALMRRARRGLIPGIRGTRRLVLGT